MAQAVGPEAVELVKSHALSCLGATLARLRGYLRIPAISCDAAHHADVRRLAGCVQQDLTELGFHSRVLELPGALPLVMAERHDAGPDAPTLLVYGHLDLQPVRGEKWSHDPHDAVVRNGRLYARGAADDMGGWVSHFAAIEAWTSVLTRLPMNVKFVIESEEEIGSPNLERFMDAHPECFSADVMILTDCENPAVDVPGLTVSLRGVFQLELRCEALQADIHSGVWGNVAPDAGNALILLLARLLDEDGRLSVGRCELPAQVSQELAQVPLDDRSLRVGSRLLDGIEPLPMRGRSPAEWMWRQPAITVLSTTFPRPEEHKNAVRAKASAALSIRIAPGQKREELVRAIAERVCSHAPAGVRVTLTETPGAAESFLYNPSGPAF
ncbi:MAG TPA: M20/M25/M40 family metallo-hydrolase, partial [Polyangiaceae bacterium]|nr:M20/M25/M40 family metallo-hydrolase [Polyangiaceae bacterium]